MMLLYGHIPLIWGMTLVHMHPLVSMLYFIVMIGVTFFVVHPLLIGISFLSAVAYVLHIKGRSVLRLGLLLILPMLIFTAMMNPLFNHQGITILMYLPNGNPITQEAILFGLIAAGKLVTVVIWFTCVNAVITSDKMVYLMGRVMPVFSLILTMSLRFIPLFITQAKLINNAHKAMGVNLHPFKVLSILVTWALENAIETADSMKARGYGLPNRTAFHIFSFRKNDKKALLFIVICTTIIVISMVNQVHHFRFFPSVQGNLVDVPIIIMGLVYFMLGTLPIILKIKEELYWKRITSIT